MFRQELYFAVSFGYKMYGFPKQHYEQMMPASAIVVIAVAESVIKDRRRHNLSARCPKISYSLCAVPNHADNSFLSLPPPILTYNYSTESGPNKP